VPETCLTSQRSSTFLCTTGTATGCGLFLAASLPCWNAGVFVALLSLFHFSEFWVSAYIDPETCSLDSFLLNHSLEYWIAVASSWIEFWLEWLWFPGEHKHFIGVLLEKYAFLNIHYSMILIIILLIIQICFMVRIASFLRNLVRESQSSE